MKCCSENMQLIYWRIPVLKFDFNKFAKQIYWSHTLAWVFSCRFAAYFQYTFSGSCFCLYDKGRSSRPEVLFKNFVIRKFAKFRGKHLRKTEENRLRPTTLLKKRIWHRCFPVNFEKFLATHFLTEHLRRLHGKGQRRIWDPVKQLRWNIVSKKFTAKSHYVFTRYKIHLLLVPKLIRYLLQNSRFSKASCY